MAFGSRYLKGGARGKGSSGWMTLRHMKQVRLIAAAAATVGSVRGERERGVRGRGVGSWPHKLQNNCKCHGYVYMRCKLQRKLKLGIARGNFFEGGREGEAVAIKAN